MTHPLTSILFVAAIIAAIGFMILNRKDKDRTQAFLVGSIAIAIAVWGLYWIACDDSMPEPRPAAASLCVTPSVTITVQCWGMVSGIDATLEIPAEETRCCPDSSGSFTTTPVTVAGTYTGYNGSPDSRPFQSWHSSGQVMTGGFK